jgi:hypothetical protein
MDAKGSKKQTKKTAPAAAPALTKAAKKSEKALVTTKKTAASPASPAKEKAAGPPPVLTHAAVRNMLKIEFKRRTGHDDTHLSPDFVDAVKDFLTTDLLTHTKNAAAVSRYRGLKSTDADAFDLLSLIKFNCTTAIDKFLYSEKDNKITDIMSKKPLLLTSA